ncbi:AraC family transcriptional regulator [Pedobacter heparinus]|uniref:AraC family transcriptional regulator n=1 Tax=Pedobacter heparinus TaxID=984 RepID=UPI00293093C4|nr:AraC family transcriptional regulator [Pedobacter heparinus]
MQSPIALHLDSAIVETLSFNSLPKFCSWPVPYARADLMTFPEGQILRQSFSSYLAHIDFYEYALNKDITINFYRDKPSIFMLLMFKGCASLHKSAQHFLYESPKGGLHMGYINEGDFTGKVKAGMNQLLLLTLRNDWVVNKAERLTQLKPIVTEFQNAKQSNFYLPDCPINWNVLKEVQKTLYQDGSKQQHLDIVIDQTLTQLTVLYDGMLAGGKYTTQVINKMKAREIEAFIHSHYAEKIEDNVTLAQRFNVSERQFLRLVKIAFDMPLHDYLIKLRMNKAIVMLISSNKPIHEIAAAVGYTDAHYFSTAFKKFHNIKPSEVHGLCL